MTLSDVVIQAAEALNKPDLTQQWLGILKDQMIETPLAMLETPLELLGQCGIPARALGCIRLRCQEAVDAAASTSMATNQDSGQQSLRDQFDIVPQQDCPRFNSELLDLSVRPGRIKGSIRVELVANEVNFTGNMILASPSVPVHSVSLLGDTTAGKSFIGTKLLEHFYETSRLLGVPVTKPKLQEQGSFVSTTSGLNVYHAPLQFRDGQIRIAELLDFEGENGTVPKGRMELLKDAANKFWGFASEGKISESEKEEVLNAARRKGVTEFLPALAFAFSDVMIYVGSDSFTNAKYLDRMALLTTSLKDNLRDARKPTLIFLRNKCPDSELTSAMEATAGFLGHHDPTGDFQSQFEAVHCLCLPHERSNKTLFEKHFHELEEVLLGAWKRHAALIAEKLIRVPSHRLRFYLMQRVIDAMNQGETVEMESLMDRLLSMEGHDALVDEIPKFFHQLYSPGSTNPDLFRRARQTALDVLVRAYVVYYLENSTLAGAIEWNPDVVPEGLAKTIEMVWNLIMQFQPCEAKSNQVETKDGKKTLLCGRSREAHRLFNGHQSCSRVSVKESYSQTRGWGLWKKVVRLSRFGDQQFHEWRGDFFSEDAVALADVRDRIWRSIIEGYANGTGKEKAVRKLGLNDLTSQGFTRDGGAEFRVIPDPSVHCFFCSRRNDGICLVQAREEEQTTFKLLKGTEKGMVAGLRKNQLPVCTDCRRGLGLLAK